MFHNPGGEDRQEDDGRQHRDDCEHLVGGVAFGLGCRPNGGRTATALGSPSANLGEAPPRAAGCPAPGWPTARRPVSRIAELPSWGRNCPRRRPIRPARLTRSGTLKSTTCKSSPAACSAHRRGLGPPGVLQLAPAPGRAGDQPPVPLGPDTDRSATAGRRQPGGHPTLDTTLRSCRPAVRSNSATKMSIPDRRCSIART